MQFHYVVGYDSVSMRWWIENDTTAYFSDGNVWDDNQYKESFYGWKVPEEGSPEEALDLELYNILESCIPGILPTPAISEAS